MTAPSAPVIRTPWRRGLVILIGGLIAAVVLVFVAIGGQRTVSEWVGYVGALHPHAPNLALLAESPWPIKVHLSMAMTALIIGIVQMSGVKGNRLHRVLGWTWVIAMTGTAVSSFFIRELNHGSFSLIHLLSGWTLIALPMALVAIRAGKVAAHARAMMGLFLGGLLIAGVLSFIPGRLMWQMFFS